MPTFHPATLWILITATLLSSCAYLPPSTASRPAQRPIIERSAPRPAPARVYRTPAPVRPAPMNNSSDFRSDSDFRPESDFRSESDYLDQPELHDESDYRHSMPSLEEPAAPPSRTQSAESRLYAQAEQHVQAEEYDKAEIAIERALRINPYSPSSYLRLAELHARRQDWRGAEQLALKALNYAGYHPQSERQGLRTAAWELILDARQSQGDSRGTREAQQKINELQYGE